MNAARPDHGMAQDVAGNGSNEFGTHPASNATKSRFQPRKCDYCGNIYSPRRRKSEYCGTPCRVAAWRERDKAASRSFSARLAALESRVAELERGR